MKNYKAVFASLLLMASLIALVDHIQAASVAVAPKPSFLLSYTTTVSTVTPVISTNASASPYAPGAVYQVILGTGAQVEFFEMYDATGTAGQTCGGNLVNGVTALGPRIFFGTSTANGGMFRFDPPLEFQKGLIACDSAATGQTSITYELGRGLSGN